MKINYILSTNLSSLKSSANGSSLTFKLEINAEKFSIISKSFPSSNSFPSNSFSSLGCFLFLIFINMTMTNAMMIIAATVTHTAMAIVAIALFAGESLG